MPPGFSDIQEVNGRFVGVYGTPYYELAETDAPERLLSIAGAGEDHLAMDRLGRIFRLEENRWQWIARVPHDAPLRLAALNEETWLVAGGRGKLAVYRNGKWEWPVKPAPDFDLFFDAVADDGNGRAVIAGANGALFYSDDLNQWHPARSVRHRICLSKGRRPWDC